MAMPSPVKCADTVLSTSSIERKRLRSARDVSSAGGPGVSSTGSSSLHADIISNKQSAKVDILISNIENMCMSLSPSSCQLYGTPVCSHPCLLHRCKPLSPASHLFHRMPTSHKQMQHSPQGCLHHHHHA